jgi:hypothetical protein
MERRGGAAGAVARWLLLAFVVLVLAPAAAQATITFVQKPANPTNQIAATFAFHDSNGGSSFACLLDAVTVPCAAHDVAKTYATALGEGPHTFSVQPIGGTGVVAPTTYGWTVDLTPPTTQVTSQPPAVTDVKTSTFTFTSTDPTATFQCSLNGAGAAPCTSPVTLSNLGDATRSMLIQAVDPAGNVDPLAQAIRWTVDTTPPDTVLANPGNLVGRDVAVFTFTSTEAGSTFQCSFDGGVFAACTSPDAIDVPGSGPQIFRARAIDPAGNVDLSPATYAWTSDLTAPKRPRVTIFAAPKATASITAPRPVAKKNPGLGVTFTNPLKLLLATPTFTLADRLHAQWSSDATAKTFDVTIDTFPQDSTGMGFHGEDLDLHREYRATRRTAVTLHLYPGSTVCVKADAQDAVGNMSRTRTACTTVPVSFTPRDIGPPPVKDAKAYHGYYIRLGAKGYEFVQDIGDEFFFAPTHAALVAERCHDCGVVEFDFDRFVGNKKNKLHELATVNLNSSDTSGEFHLITVSLPVHRLARFGMGDLVIRAVSGRPRLAGIGISN